MFRFVFTLLLLVTTIYVAALLWDEIRTLIHSYTE